MTAPRKEKKRSTGRPLEDVPLRNLVSGLKKELKEKLRPALAASRKSQKH